MSVTCSSVVRSIVICFLFKSEVLIDGVRLKATILGAVLSDNVFDISQELVKPSATNSELE